MGNLLAVQHYLAIQLVILPLLDCGDTEASHNLPQPSPDSSPDLPVELSSPDSSPDLPVELSSPDSSPDLPLELSSPDSSSDSPTELEFASYPEQSQPEPQFPAVTTTSSTPAEGTSHSQLTPATALLLDDLATISCEKLSERQKYQILL